MKLPLFYIPEYLPDRSDYTLEEENSRHIVQVLRMKEGDHVHVTDGMGNLLTAEITGAHKKHSEIRIIDSGFTPAGNRHITIGISLLKNASRFEWFLEKATELGVKEIIPLLCDRTVKEKFRQERMQQICVSAMLQSQQSWLPRLHLPVAFEKLFIQEEIAKIERKFIAHCEPVEQKDNLLHYRPFDGSVLLLVGPEGDFTHNEIVMAQQCNCLPVSLGDNRLRTETAGIAAAAILCLAS